MELKELADSLQKDWKDYKETNQKLIEAKADGKTVTDLEEKLGKLNKALDKSSEKLTEVETAIKRQLELGANGGKKEEVYQKVIKKTVREFFKKGMGDERITLSAMVQRTFNDNPDIKEAYVESLVESKSLSVQSEIDGGYFVHADMNGRIIKRLFETSPIRQYAAVASIASDAIEGVVDADEVGYGYVSEKAARPPTATAPYGTWRIETHEIYAEPAMTQKVMDDAAFDLEGEVMRKVSDKFARLQNRDFVLGSGDGKPQGFLTVNTITDAANASASYDSYIKDKKVGYIPTGVADAFPAIPDTGDPAQGNPLIDAMYALKSQYRNGPGLAWAMHRTTVAAIRKLQDAFGNYLWSPGFNGQPQQFFGAPIAEFNDMPVLGATNKYAIAIANWREFYQIVDRIGIRMLRDPYTSKPYTLFYTTTRYGGKPLNFEAAKFVKFATS